MSEQINRISLTKTLEQRYASDKTGGAFDAKKANTNTAILGLQGDFGYTQLSRELTIEPGFTTGMATNKKENFTDNVLGGNGKRGVGQYRTGNTARYRP
jgi:hypothetical protein